MDAFRTQLAASGVAYPYHHAPPPNSIHITGLDLDGDGRTSSREDRQGYGRFSGDGGLALLSRFPIRTPDIKSYSDLLWAELPDTELPENMTPEAKALQRLSSSSHVNIPIALPDGSTLTILAYAATPPVFDDEYDRNGLRNSAETAFWEYWLDGHFGTLPGHFALMGNANLDPDRGDGRRGAIRSLLRHPALQDPLPTSQGAASMRLGGAADTVDWPEPTPANMRVSYILPARTLTVAAVGVVWPPSGSAFIKTVETAGPHRLVWTDIVIP